MWLFKVSIIFLFFTIASCHYSRRNFLSEINPVEVCKNKGPNEYFRLSVEANCREVYQCNEHGKNGLTLLPLRCPAGLVFDIEKQTCAWRNEVNNCKQLEKTKLNVPILSEIQSCETGKLQCGSKECIERELFCDEKFDCADGSDESLCGVGQDPNGSPVCDPKYCQLPDCYCSQNGTSIPNDLPRETVPQMIMITFDDAVNNNNIDIYDEIFQSSRTNPNGCSIKATFFLSHKYSNYSAVQDLHKKGHEIAVHSITHNSGEKYWSNGTIEQWTKEMAGAKLIFERFANITDNSIVGMRAPLLKVGGNNQFGMMQDNSFLYDSSMGAAFSEKPLYPYTLHHRMPHNCHGNFQKCPTRSHPVWEIPMNEYDRRVDDDDFMLSGCVMVDQCSNLVNGELLYNFLNRNFYRHYNSNRAPLGLYFHASWLLNRDFLDSLIQWIDDKLEMDDVYFTTMAQVIDWMKKPTALKDIKYFEPWQHKCLVQGPPSCFYPNQCALVSRELPGETNRLHTCMECSKYYPWINDPTGDYDPEE